MVKNLLIQAAFAAALLSGAIAVASEAGLIVRQGPPDTATATERPGAKIRVSGSVKGLYPGARKRIKVRVANRYPRGVKLVGVRARVQRAGPGCGKGFVVVKRFHGTRWIFPKSKRRVNVRVKMRGNAPDACQGQRFPIRFRARVKRWNRP